MDQTHKGGLQNITSAIVCSFHPRTRLLRELKSALPEAHGFCLSTSKRIQRYVMSRLETQGRASSEWMCKN